LYKHISDSPRGSTFNVQPTRYQYFRTIPGLLFASWFNPHATIFHCKFVFSITFVFKYVCFAIVNLWIKDHQLPIPPSDRSILATAW